MTSKRYCFVCDKITTFKIDNVIRHSCCKNCGARMGCRPDNAVLIHFQKKLKKEKKTDNKIINDNNVLKKRVELQRANITGLHQKVNILKAEISVLKKEIKELKTKKGI